MTIRVTNDIDFRGHGDVDVDTLDVGFFVTATYDDEDNTPVAQVAATHEYGSVVQGVPERPFFRNAIAELEDIIPRVLATAMTANGFNIRRRDAERVGEVSVGKVQESIVNLRTPPNSPATIERKGSSNPLIDEGVMLGSVGYQVNA